MTLWGIDVSEWQAGIDFQRIKDEGFSFVIARVGQGAGGNYVTHKDSEWLRHRDECRRVGLTLVAYWYIGSKLSPDDNARICQQWMEDDSVPVALDCENGSGDINHFRDIVNAFTNRGLHVALSYIPKWYWNSIGAAILEGLPPLWASHYVNGSDYASNLYPGDVSSFWDGYGNNHVEVLQFSSSAIVASYIVDADAYKGTLDQFKSLLTPPPPTPVPVPSPSGDLEASKTMSGLNTYWNVDASKGRAYCSFEVGSNSAIFNSKYMWVAANSLWGDIPDVFVNFLGDDGNDLPAEPVPGTSAQHVSFLVNKRHWWKVPSGASIVTFEWNPATATGVLAPYLVWG